jgi:hypothetical protein
MQPKTVLFACAVVSITAGLASRSATAQSGAQAPAVSIARHTNLWQNVWPGDFNGDGITDLAASDAATVDGGTGKVLVVIGAGGGGFGSPIVADFVGHVVNVGDFNKDHQSDLVVVSEGRTRAAILPGQGDGSFGAAVTVFDGSDITFAVDADLNGDGNRDLIVAHEGFTALVFPGNGDLTFDPPVTLTTGAFPLDAIVADLNGDGRNDFVVANHYYHSVTVFLNQGAMLFTAADVAVGGNGNDVTVADLNRDGILDLAVATSNGGDTDNYFEEGHADILLGRGDGTFDPPVRYSTARGAWQIVAGDFNRDGVTDIVTANRSSIFVDDCSGGIGGKTWDSVSVLTGGGDGTLRPARSFSIGDPSDPVERRYRNRVVSLNTNDVNADGSTDLIASYGAILFNAPAHANRAPGVSAPSFTTNTSDVLLHAVASDPDDDLLQWTWRDRTGFAFAGWPDICSMGGLLDRGENVFTVTVDDGNGHQATETVTIFYEPPADDTFVTFTAPQTDSVVIAGEPFTIRWNGPASIAAEDLFIGYSVDGGLTFTDIPGCGPVRVDAGQCAWSNPGPLTENAFLYAATRSGTIYATGFAGQFAIRTPTTSALPSPWLQTDVGAVGAAGSTSFADGVFTVKGSGDDVFGTVDAFHYVSQQFGGCGIGDFDAVTRVDSVENVHRWTRAGLMVRAGLDASAAHASIFITPGKGVAFQRRPVAGGQSLNTSGPLVTAPVWLRLSGRGSTVIGYYKLNAADPWTMLDDEILETPCAGRYTHVGLAVVSKQDGTLASAAFSNVSIAPWSPQWSTALIGSVSGTSAPASGTPPAYTLTNRGADIWGTADQFTFLNREWYGDAHIVTQIESLTNTHAAAKAGVMIRATRDPDSPHVMLVVQPAKGIAMQYRSRFGGNSAQIAQLPAIAAPVFLRLTRNGSLFTGEWSADGAAWNRVGSITMPLARETVVGLALTSHNTEETAIASYQATMLGR